MKEFVPKDEANKPPKGGGCNIEHDCHGEKRANETHVSTAHPDARLFRRRLGNEAKLCHMGHTNLLASRALQERVVSAVLNGRMPWRKAASHFAVGISTVINWVRHFGKPAALRLVFQGAPQAFDEDVIHPAAAAVHRDLDPLPIEDAGEGGAGELVALVSVENVRLAEAHQRSRDVHRVSRQERNRAASFAGRHAQSPPPRVQCYAVGKLRKSGKKI